MINKKKLVCFLICVILLSYLNFLTFTFLNNNFASNTNLYSFNNKTSKAYSSGKENGNGSNMNNDVNNLDNDLTSDAVSDDIKEYVVILKKNVNKYYNFNESDYTKKLLSKSDIKLLSDRYRFKDYELKLLKRRYLNKDKEKGMILTRDDVVMKDNVINLISCELTNEDLIVTEIKYNKVISTNIVIGDFDDENNDDNIYETNEMNKMNLVSDKELKSIINDFRFDNTYLVSLKSQNRSSLIITKLLNDIRLINIDDEKITLALTKKENELLNNVMQNENIIIENIREQNEQ